MRDTRGLIYSTTLHGLILFFLIVGLPNFFPSNALPPEPVAISVDILPIAAMSNVKPQDEAKKEKESKVETAPKARPETHEEKKPDPAPPVPLPPKPKPKPTPPQPKPKPTPPKPKPKPAVDPLKDIFKGIEKEAAKEGPKTEKKTTESSHKKAESQHYDPGAPLSMSDKDAIRQQISQKWNFPAGAKNASSLKVSLHVEVERDGTVTKVEFVGDTGRYNSDSFFRSAVDSAIRAVHLASPLKNLPADKYNVQDGWKDIIMDFTPPDT